MAIEVRHGTGVLVVSLTGGAGGELLPSLAATLAGVGGDQAVVLDVDDLTLAPSTLVELLIDDLNRLAATLRPRRCALVAGRLSARRLLRHAGVLPDIAIVPTLDGALRALSPDPE